MCKYKRHTKSSDTGDYYTLGIHRTARFTTPSSTSQPPFTRHAHTAVNQQRAPAAVTSLLTTATYRPRDVTAGSGVKKWNKIDNGGVRERQSVTSTGDNVTSDTTATTATTTATTAATVAATAAADADDDDDDDDFWFTNVGVEDDSSDDDDALNYYEYEDDDQEDDDDEDDHEDDDDEDDHEDNDHEDDELSSDKRVAALIYYGIR